MDPDRIVHDLVPQVRKAEESVVREVSEYGLLLLSLVVNVGGPLRFVQAKSTVEKILQDIKGTHRKPIT